MGKKLTESRLRQLVREEIHNVLNEEDDDLDSAVKFAKKVLSDEDMAEELAANAASKKYGVSKSDVLDVID